MTPSRSGCVPRHCVIGLTPFTFRSGGGSDANIFNGMGVPTVNLAIGYEHIHTTNEQIKADDLVRTAELVMAIMVQTAQQHADR